MTNAKQLAREIIDRLNEHEHASYEEAIELVASVVAPLVSGAEKYHKLMEINDRMQKCTGHDD